MISGFVVITQALIKTKFGTWVAFTNMLFIISSTTFKHGWLIEI